MERIIDKLNNESIFDISINAPINRAPKTILNLFNREEIAE